MEGEPIQDDQEIARFESKLVGRYNCTGLESDMSLTGPLVLDERNTDQQLPAAPLPAQRAQPAI